MPQRPQIFLWHHHEDTGFVRTLVGGVPALVDHIAPKEFPSQNQSQCLEFLHMAVDIILGPVCDVYWSD